MKLIECPRDAWQGIDWFIPTETKASYINALLKVGFDTIDFGSFVSPKAMPQVSDTAQLVKQLDLTATNTKLLAIVANERGAENASLFDEIAYVGYPFSISETFQQRNTNASITESFGRVEAIQNRCVKSGKKLVLYISMGFGNPYGDPWEAALPGYWVEQLRPLGIELFSLADTVGLARPEDIRSVFQDLAEKFPELEFGGHFHATPLEWRGKLGAAYEAGCRRFDGALLGYGGCPMAQNDLVGNMNTDHLIAFADEKNEPIRINREALSWARHLFSEIVAQPH